MGTDLIVSVSGIRGIMGQSLTSDVAEAFAHALGVYVQGRPVVVSRDSRPSGEALTQVVAGGLASAGCKVYLLGILPTPTCGLAVRQLRAAGGIQITASHNPAPYNGLKLFSSRGMILTPVEGRKVLEIYQAEGLDHPVHERAAKEPIPGQVIGGHFCPLTAHVDKVLPLVNFGRIQHQGFHVFVDANHGAGGPLAEQLLTALGCRVTMVGGNPDGQFVHEPEPTESNLRTLASLVPHNQCDIGFALDPDADRLAIIDESGHYIGEELTLALAANFRLRQARGPVVVNMSTSRVIEDVANRYGCPFHRAAVGEVNVAEKMMAVNAILGGEGNGGVIDPRVGFVRDPFIGMAMILNLLAETGRRVSDLAGDLPSYHIAKHKCQVDRTALPRLYSALQSHWPDAAVNQEDGLRLDWPNRWVHIRPSNTEPIVRIIAEAPLSELAEGMCAEVEAIMRHES